MTWVSTEEVASTCSPSPATNRTLLTKLRGTQMMTRKSHFLKKRKCKNLRFSSITHTLSSWRLWTNNAEPFRSHWTAPSHLRFHLRNPETAAKKNALDKEPHAMPVMSWPSNIMARLQAKMAFTLSSLLTHLWLLLTWCAWWACLHTSWALSLTWKPLVSLSCYATPVSLFWLPFSEHLVASLAPQDCYATTQAWTLHVF